MADSTVTTSTAAVPRRAPDESAEKLAAGVARRILGDVMERGWPVGQVLGSQAELIERYGVSRAVFREAVRLVENQQIAFMRRGPAAAWSSPSRRSTPSLTPPSCTCTGPAPAWRRSSRPASSWRRSQPNWPRSG
jgi:DNA-binding transcriptional MocR family regulator